MLSEAREKRILTLSSAGRVNEFRLLYRVNFKVIDKAGLELLSPQQIELRRDITFNDSQTLAKESDKDYYIATCKPMPCSRFSVA